MKKYIRLILIILGSAAFSLQCFAKPAVTLEQELSETADDVVPYAETYTVTKEVFAYAESHCIELTVQLSCRDEPNNPSGSYILDVSNITASNVSGWFHVLPSVSIADTLYYDCNQAVKINLQYDASIGAGFYPYTATIDVGLSEPANKLEQVLWFTDADPESIKDLEERIQDKALSAYGNQLPEIVFLPLQIDEVSDMIQNRASDEDHKESDIHIFVITTHEAEVCRQLEEQGLIPEWFDFRDEKSLAAYNESAEVFCTPDGDALDLLGSFVICPADYTGMTSAVLSVIFSGWNQSK